MTPTTLQLTVHAQTPAQLALVAETLGTAVIELGALGIACSVTSNEETPTHV